MNDWKIIIMPNGDKLKIDFNADTDQALADAKEALAEFSVSGVPDDLKAPDITVNYRGQTLSMSDYLVLCATAKVYEQLEPDEAEVFFAELKAEVHRARKSLEGDPEIEAYLSEHPEERAKMDRIREIDMKMGSDV